MSGAGQTRNARKRTHWRDKPRYVLVENTEAFAVEPFGVMEIVGVNRLNGAFRIRQPTINNRMPLLFNGPQPIPARNSKGEATLGQAVYDFPIVLAFGSLKNEIPQPGEEWGSKAGSWKIWKNQRGFTVEQVGENGRVTVLPAIGPTDRWLGQIICMDNSAGCCEYGWIEVGASGCSYLPIPGGRYGGSTTTTTSSTTTTTTAGPTTTTTQAPIALPPAHEINGNCQVAMGTIVEMWLSYDGLHVEFEHDSVANTTGPPPSCTTTTTPAPCTGGCKWTWDNTAKTWSQTSTTCSAGCICNTPKYCGSTSPECTQTDCIRGQQQPPPIACTTTTGTTTTTGAPCGVSCKYTCTPAGWVLTSTNCGAGSCGCPTIPPNKFCTSGGLQCTNCYGPGGTVLVPCQTGLSTSTTTSTMPPNCTSGCTWRCYLSLGQWIKTTNGCLLTCPCFIPNTPCIVDCATANTPCMSTTTTRPPPPSCNGICKWRFNPDTSSWVALSNTCQASGGPPPGPCICTPPTVAGTSCEQATTGCFFFVPTTTTTTTGSPTGCVGQCTYSCNPDQGAWGLIYDSCVRITGSGRCDCNYDPIGLGWGICGPGGGIQFKVMPCTGPDGGSGNPPATTTTTNSPTGCNGTCRWKWDGTKWTVQSRNCPFCSCEEPGYSGVDGSCETVETACLSTTTTTTSSTTTTTTTTTTTCAPNNCTTDSCLFTCTSGVWVLTTNCANSGCRCYHCSLAGQACSGGTFSSVCICGSACTTTTTSATTTTTAGPCGACSYVCIGGVWVGTGNTCTGICVCPPGIGGQPCSPDFSSYSSQCS